MPAVDFTLLELEMIYDMAGKRQDQAEADRDAVRREGHDQAARTHDSIARLAWKIARKVSDAPEGVLASSQTGRRPPGAH